MRNSPLQRRRLSLLIFVSLLTALPARAQAQMNKKASPSSPPAINADPSLLPPDNRTSASHHPKIQIPCTEILKNTGDATDRTPDGGGLGPGPGGHPGAGGGYTGGGGPGGGGNDAKVDYTRTFRTNEVTRRAKILNKPQPSYTEKAYKNDVEGFVRIRLVLAATGDVKNMQVVKGLPDGLTEKAIEAAREIKFTPAQKDGRVVSQWATVEYNFIIIEDERRISDKAVILEQPPAQYTREACANRVEGTVVLRVLLTRRGEIGDIEVEKDLPFGLTGNAMEAARLIKFKPAENRGKPVNVERRIEYVFRLN